MCNFKTNPNIISIKNYHTTDFRMQMTLNPKKLLAYSRQSQHSILNFYVIYSFVDRGKYKKVYKCVSAFPFLFSLYGLNCPSKVSHMNISFY